MKTIHPEKPQLCMAWPVSELRRFPAYIIADGYSVRTFQPGDEQPFLELMSAMDFDPWDEAKLNFNISKVLPGGWFFTVDSAGRPVATAMCLHNYSGDTPFTGDVGWLACHPDHRGNSLGFCLTASVTQRFLDAGYTKIQLHTEYYRLPALKTYLKLGYVPLISSPETTALWKEVCAQLNWPFTPEMWQRTDDRRGGFGRDRPFGLLG